jgi:hypothetical protein
MLPRNLISAEVRRLIERRFLEAVTGRTKLEYGGLSDDGKKDLLKAFLQRIAGETKQWATVLQDLL